MLNFIKKNKLKFFLLVIFLTIITLVTLITFKTSLRHQIFSLTIGGLNYFQNQSILYYIKLRDYETVSRKIEDYIDISNRISPGKTSLLDEIYNITELATNNIISQEQYNQMEKVYLKLNEISDDIYKNHLWLAQALSDNDIEKSYLHLNKAINLSPSSEDVYREILNIYFKDKRNDSLIKMYCQNYFLSLNGGNLIKDNINYLYGSNNEFVIFFNDNLEKKYVKFIDTLNEFNEYEFNFPENFKIKKLTIIKSFLNGSRLTFKDFKFHGDITKSIKIDDLNFTSRTSYILKENENFITLLNTTDNDDKLEINFQNEYSNFFKISFKIKLEKLPLTNKSVCK